MPTPILFLDFDGVLHPEHRGDPYDPAKALIVPFSCLLRLEQALAGLHYRVVVTSTWRAHAPAEELAGYLGPEIGSRVIGTTPHLSFLERDDRQIRQAEILRWLLLHNETDTPFLTLDDWHLDFEPDWPNLYLVNFKTGLTDGDAENIRLMMMERGA